MILPSFIEDIATSKQLADGPRFRPPEPRTDVPASAKRRCNNPINGPTARWFDAGGAGLNERAFDAPRGRCLDADGERGAGELTPREAAFAVALLNRTRPAIHLEPGPAAARLAECVWRARPQDCLDAAFSASLGKPPRGLVAGLHERRALAPPFLDETMFRCIALYLGTTFVADVSAHGLRPTAFAGSDVLGGTAVPVGGGGEFLWLIAPDPAWLPALAALSCARPDLACRIGIATPANLAAAFPEVVPRTDMGRLYPLHRITRDQVAAHAITPLQASAIALTGATLAGFWLLLPGLANFSAATALNVALLGHAATRLAAAQHANAGDHTRAFDRPTKLPIYSVLIPLHREAAVAGQIIDACAALDYPQSRLDIQFLVEAHDTATHDALAARIGPLGEAATITIVPEGLPRTKPRALNVGLKRARGDFVTVFDAEDRPEPDQLLKAVAAFEAEPSSVACVQARLIIDHANDSWITRMFAIEYASLFDGILPMLSDKGWFFLLGGTSNHFKRDVLVKVGGWDPYNVTEDADLAVRLARNGYALRQLSSSTYEEAPLTMGAWMRQRTRWFKGWMQTWLIHNRNPLYLMREMGVRDCLIFHVLVLGSFLSTLAHPFFCGLLLLYAAGAINLSPELTATAVTLFALNAAVFIVGYGATFWLGALAMRRRGMPVPIRAIATLPLYWFLMSGALVLALRELVLRPHYWAKTKHGLASRPLRIFGSDL